MRWRGRFSGLLAAVGLLLLGTGAYAQNVVPSSAVEFEDAEIFRPTTDASDYVTVYDSDTLPQRFFYLGFWGDYARNPIEIQFEDSGDLFTHVLAFSPGFMAPTATRDSPRFFVSHGTDDPVLPIDRTSRRLVPMLEAAGYTVDYREFEGGHTVPPEMVAAAVALLLG